MPSAPSFGGGGGSGGGSVNAVISPQATINVVNANGPTVGVDQASIVAGATVGSTTISPTVTIDQYGRVTALTPNTIAAGGGGITGLTSTQSSIAITNPGGPSANLDLPTVATAGSVGSTTVSPTITIDKFGRVLSITPNTIAGGVGTINNLTSSDSSITITTPGGPTTNLILPNIVAATGPIGSPTVSPSITIDAKGRVTALTANTISGGGGGGSGAVLGRKIVTAPLNFSVNSSASVAAIDATNLTLTFTPTGTSALIEIAIPSLGFIGAALLGQALQLGLFTHLTSTPVGSGLQGFSMNLAGTAGNVYSTYFNGYFQLTGLTNGVPVSVDLTWKSNFTNAQMWYFSDATPATGVGPAILTAIAP